MNKIPWDNDNMNPFNRQDDGIFNPADFNDRMDPKFSMYPGNIFYHDDTSNNSISDDWLDDEEEEEEWEERKHFRVEMDDFPEYYDPSLARVFLVIRLSIIVIILYIWIIRIFTGMN